MKKLTLGSLFSGSGGFEVAGILSGIEPIWNSEVLPFAKRVTTKRLPQVKHYGDISKLNGAELPPVDIITFGSPCQSVSIAGRRDGIKHTAHGDDTTTRSGLFFEAIRIIKEMRCATNDQYPRYIVFENVSGLYSSSGGEDFRTVLEEICSIKEADVHIPRPAKKWHYAGEIVGDGYSVAWRTLDAQYFNVPQRRVRCFLVGSFGGASAGKILFESEGLSGYSEACRSERQRTAAAAQNGSGTAGTENVTVINDQGGERIDVTENMTATLRAQAHHPPVVLESAGFCTEHSAKARSVGYEKEIAPTLRAGTVPAALSCFSNHSQDTRYTGPEEISQTISSTFGQGGNNQPFVVESHAFGICSAKSNAMKSDNPKSGFYEADTSRTIDTSTQSPVRNQGGMAVVQPIKNYDVRLTSEGTKNARSNVYETEFARTIDTGGIAPNANQGGIAVVAVQGSMIGRKDENGPQGSGVNEDISFSLTCADHHAVAYGIHRAAFNQWCGCPVDTSQPQAEKHRPSRQARKNALYNFAVEEEIEPTMVAKGCGCPVDTSAAGRSTDRAGRRDPGAVAQPTYCTSKNSHHTKANVELAGTLVESDYKDPPVINDTDGIEYIVRRLTPSECAVLQGYDRDWCSNLGTENPTAEDIAYWREVFNEYNHAIGKSVKPKSDNQIIKWLKDPHSDSAEYSLWGNGLCKWCAVFVLSGIAYFDAHEEEIE